MFLPTWLGPLCRGWAMLPGRAASRGGNRRGCGAAPGWRTAAAPRGFGPALVVALALCMLLLGACAKSSDVQKIGSDMQKVAETDRVQNQRLSSLENDVGKALNSQNDQVKQLTAQVAALQARVDKLDKTSQQTARTQDALKGRTSLLEQNTKQLTDEQQAVSNSMDRTAADQRKLQHMVTEQVDNMKRFRLNTENDLDRMRGQTVELEKLLKSPIAGLPDSTVADRAMRQAYYHLISGEFDIAADQFGAWEKKYPKNPRVPEAEYRQGEAYFLMRRYDHTLIPLFELVRKYPKSPFVNQARWLLARSLEETGDLKLAREFYAQLIKQNTPYSADATRRVSFIDRLYPHSAGSAKPAKP